MEIGGRTKWAIFNNPLPLLEIKNKNVISAINNYFPYSVGMEIECMHGINFNPEAFVNIPNIMDSQNSSPEYEQRYRVPRGLEGLVCLWNICEQLKLNCIYHEESGHHYHIDCTDVYNSDFVTLAGKNSEWILNVLDTWGYTGSYNGRRWGSYYRNNCGHKTLEFRCADMTFEYPIMVKRMISASNIVRKLKNIFSQGIEVIELENLQNHLKTLQKEKQEEVITPNYSDLATEIIKSRIKRI